MALSNKIGIISSSCALFALILMMETGLVHSGCLEAKLCCSGRNDTCRVKGDRDSKLMNALSPSGPQYCYCDEGCHATKDCCRDREESCGGAVDCVVSKWAGWGQCSRLCDSGVQERYRNITKPPRNGGKLCPPLKQERVCFGNKCKHTRDFRKQEARETGRIIPAAFGTWRKSKVYDFSKDIRKNLYYKYYYANAITRTSYYATYEIVSSRRVCQKSNITPWAKVLEKGAQICVECQPTAMWKSLGTRCKGHGVINQITRWNAVNARGCHGKWIMRTVHKEGRCDEGTRKDFIFI